MLIATGIQELNDIRASYIDSLEKTIKLLREQIASLENDKIWYREQLEVAIVRGTGNQFDNIRPIEDPEEFSIPIHTSSELPSQRRTRLARERFERSKKRHGVEESESESESTGDGN